MIIKENEILANHCSFHIGGQAKYYVVPENEDEIKEAFNLSKEKSLPLYVIGRGSNLLFDDEGFQGIIMEIGKGMSKIESRSLDEKRTLVKAEAGISMANMASQLAKWELTGFECQAGIPGTLGGGIVMNAGAYGGEIKDNIVSVKSIDRNGQIHKYKKEEMDLGYRTSIFQRNDEIVIEAEFIFEKGNSQDILDKMKDLAKKRTDKQPLEFPSAGSTFKRPEGYFAGKLIEDAGLRGYRVGDAMVSEKHCGFVINAGNATSKDVLQLMSDVTKKVWDEFKVELEPEVRIIPKSL